MEWELSNCKSQGSERTSWRDTNDEAKKLAEGKCEEN